MAVKVWAHPVPSIDEKDITPSRHGWQAGKSGWAGGLVPPSYPYLPLDFLLVFLYYTAMSMMSVGDIWRKDTREIYEGNRVQHWLITNIYPVEDARWSVDFLYLETGRCECVVLHTINMTGNPYWKRVA